MGNPFLRRNVPHIVLLGVMVLFQMFGWGWAGIESNSALRLDAHLSDTYTDDLPGLLQRKYIRVLTTINRTNFFLADGRLHGFEYALLKAYEAQLNSGIGRNELKVTLEFIPVSRDRLIPGLIEGRGDIAAAGLTITEKRLEKIDFTRPYLTGINEILVTFKNVPSPAKIEDLSGKQVFVRKSSSYYDSLTALNHRLQENGLAAVKIVEADEALETEDILEMVNTGAIKRTVADSHLADIWAGVLDDIAVHETIKFREGGRIAWAVRRDNPKLKQSLDGFIKGHRQGTLLGNIFFNRYYRDNNWIKNPFKNDGSKKVDALRPLLLKYADRYGFDWRLILAMAFQESGLDPDKKSAKGAVGLLQILPSTAADPNVGIKNITGLENNVHAGIKYLDFLRTRYFSDNDIRSRDRVRFSLASYNAGPANIRRARIKASQMGLDPDRWFRNVEIAALKVIGREPVQYVSNINKYYVIYKNALPAEGDQTN
jgi:membrane-bound lytic murein transglycosylase MltF